MRETLASLELGLEEAIILKELEKAGGARLLNQLREDLAVEPAKLTRIANSLEEKGLVQRVSPKANHRLVELVLTDTGWDTCEGLEDAGNLDAEAGRWKRLNLAKAELGLSSAQAACLMALCRHVGEPLPASQVAAEAGVKRTTAAMALKRLEETGHVSSLADVHGATRYQANNAKGTFFVASSSAFASLDNDDSRGGRDA